LVAASVLALAAQHQLNPDGIAYIRAARHYTAGAFDLAISGWWSPLLIWLLVPAVAVGADPILTVKLLGVGLGVIFALGVALILREIGLGLHAYLGFAGSLLVALVMIPEPISPDLLVAAVLTLYFAASVRLIWSASPSHWLVSGLIGGVAYLAKSYALPFVTVHLVFTFALQLNCSALSYQVPGGRPRRPTLVAAPGRRGFHPRWGIDGGPGCTGRSLRGTSPPFTTLQAPRPGRLTVWENPKEISAPWPFWSPLDGLAGIKRQAQTIILGSRQAINALRVDSAGLTLIGLVLAVGLLSPRPLLPMHRIRLWALGSILVYATGYILIFVEPRYIWPAWGLTLALVIAGPRIEASSSSMDSKGDGRRCITTLERLYPLFITLLLASLGATALETFEEWTVGGKRGYYASLKELGGEISGKGRVIASNDWYRGLYVSYWAREGVFLGASRASTSVDVVKELESFAPVTLLVFGNPELQRSLAGDPRVLPLETTSKSAAVFTVRSR
jgi:hypothetical protein